jgi:hypothetical protein
MKSKLYITIGSKKQIMPQGLQQITNNCILSGGAIVSLIHGDEPHDYDLLFNFTSDMVKVMDDVVNKKYNIIPENLISDKQEYYMNEEPSGKCVTDWAVTLTNRIQFIFRQANYRKGFDFIHCMPYYDITRNKLFISQEQLDSIMHKQIKINPNHAQPIADYRIKKYTDRGWKEPDGYNVDTESPF